MTCGPTASARKIATHIDACEIFHKVVAMRESKPDNAFPPHISRLMQPALPHSSHTPLD
jgi:hypothetical protein